MTEYFIFCVHVPTSSCYGYSLCPQLILDRIYKGILDKVAAQGPWLVKLFEFGLEYKLNWMNRGWDTPICNWYVKHVRREIQ